MYEQTIMYFIYGVESCFDGGVNGPASGRLIGCRHSSRRLLTGQHTRKRRTPQPQHDVSTRMHIDEAGARSSPAGCGQVATGALIRISSHGVSPQLCADPTLARSVYLKTCCPFRREVYATPGAAEAHLLSMHVQTHPHTVI
jgi:hypothetical protein